MARQRPLGTTPEQILQSAYAACPSSADARLLIETIPGLHPMCISLAKLVWNIVPTSKGNEPLLHAAIREAVQAYQDTPPEPQLKLERSRAFARALLRRVSEVNQVRVCVEMGDTCYVWLPPKETLFDFLTRHASGTPVVVKEQYSSATDRTVRQVMAARLIDLPQLVALGGSLDDLVHQGAVA